MPSPGWFCCLPFREKAAIASVAPPLAASLFVGYPLDLFDVFWLPPGASLQARRAAFLDTYGLEIVTIGDEGAAFVAPLVEYIPFWAFAAVFTLEPLQGCPDGCDRPYRG